MWPTHLALLPREAGPTTADIRLKSCQQAKYVKELWLFLTAVIGLLAIFNWSSRLLLYACKLKWTSGVGVVSHGKRSPEALKPGGTGRVSLRRVPDAIGSLFRVIDFRTTVPIGPSSVMSVTELTFIVGYILALLIWLWVDSGSFHFL